MWGAEYWKLLTAAHRGFCLCRCSLVSKQGRGVYRALCSGLCLLPLGESSVCSAHKQLQWTGCSNWTISFSFYSVISFLAAFSDVGLQTPSLANSDILGARGYLLFAAASADHALCLGYLGKLLHRPFTSALVVFPSWSCGSRARDQFADCVWPVARMGRQQILLWLLSACGHHRVA